MIDDPGTAARLVEHMQHHLPGPAFPMKDLVRTLRRRERKFSTKRLLSIKHVFYAGDEGGIMSDVTPSRDPREVFIVSLTHLRIAPDHPLCAAILESRVLKVGPGLQRPDWR
jgi:hypothetical protein